MRGALSCQASAWPAGSVTRIALGPSRLKDQPLAVLVEVDYEEYKNYRLPGHEGVPPGHFFIRAISSESAWPFHTAGKEKISVVRKQVCFDSLRAAGRGCPAGSRGLPFQAQLDERRKLRA